MTIAGVGFISDKQTGCGMSSEANSGQPNSTSQNLAMTQANELVTLLKYLGLNDPSANVLVCLHHHGKLDSAGLQDRCGLRQPEVSIAINELRGYGAIQMNQEQLSGRGRPKHIYSLNGSLEEALKPIKNRATETMNQLKKQLEQLADITKQLH